MPFIKVNDVKLFYEERGQGQCLVFLHGLGADHRSWSPQASVFSQRYRTILIDLRGHGRSDKTMQKYRIDMFSSDVDALLSALRVKKAVLVGHSLGGMVALDYCLKHPERVSALVLVGTIAGLNGLMTTIVKYLKNAIIHSIPSLLRAFRRGLTYLRLTAQILKTPVYVILSAIWWAAHFNVLGRLSEIERPTLIVVGEQDMFTPPFMTEFIHLGIRGSTYRVIKDAGHVVILDQAEVFNNALSTFLEEMGPSG